MWPKGRFDFIPDDASRSSEGTKPEQVNNVCIGALNAKTAPTCAHVELDSDRRRSSCQSCQTAHLTTIIKSIKLDSARENEAGPESGWMKDRRHVAFNEGNYGNESCFSISRVYRQSGPGVSAVDQNIQIHMKRLSGNIENGQQLRR